MPRFSRGGGYLAKSENLNLKWGVGKYLGKCVGKCVLWAGLSPGADGAWGADQDGIVWLAARFPALSQSSPARERVRNPPRRVTFAGPKSLGRCL